MGRITHILSLIALLGLFNISGNTQPSIQSFSPRSAVPGTSVTIQGSGFSTTPSANQVFFGGVKGTVVSATGSTLIATVPAGAAPGQIMVYVSGLWAYSRTDFQPKSGTIYPIDGGAFKLGDTAITNYYPRNVLFSDLDLDGKPDLLALRYEPNQTYQNHIMPFKNESEPNGEVIFKPQGSFEAGIYATELALGDFDGDGKQDAVVTSIGNTTSQIKVLRNTSNSGTISFASAFSVNNTGACYYVATGDADGDGKVDILASNYLEGKILVYRNTGSPGNISFAPAVAFGAGISPGMIAFADFNGDAKPDLAVCDELFGKVIIFNNTGSSGSISFAQVKTIELYSGSKVDNLVAADLNSDGQNDLLISIGYLDNFSGTFFICTNTGNFNFSTPQVISNPIFSGAYYKPSVGDLNGDGKPDVVVGWAGEAKFGLYQNIGEPGGAINLNFSEDWFALSPFRIAIGDLNADGQPELAVASFTSTAGVGIYHNRMGKLSITDVSTFSGGQGTEVTITGYNFTGVTSVKFGNTPAAAFRVVSPNSIIATVGAGSSGRIEVTGTSGTDYWEEFIYDNQPGIVSFTPKKAGAGDTVVINGSNFLGTHTVRFGEVAAQWFTVVNRNTIKAIPGNGASGNVSVQNQEGIASLGGFIFYDRPALLDFLPKTGYTGSEVLLTGVNLNEVRFIKFGGIPADTFFIISDSQIKAIVGKGGSGNVTIVGSLSDSSSMEGFIYFPAPDITGINSMKVPPGGEVVLSGNYFTPFETLSVGGLKISPTSLTENKLTFNLPSHFIGGAIVIKTLYGSDTLLGFYNGAAISSISPLVGKKGDTVTIKGTGFISNSSDIYASIGNQRASVIEASVNQVKIIVPSGPAFGNVSLSMNGHTVSGLEPFTYSFDNKGASISSHSFQAIFPITPISGNNIADYRIADIDMDEKQDLILLADGYINIYRNTGQPGLLSFSKVEIEYYTTNINLFIEGFQVRDLNHDGKPDLIINHGEYGQVDILINECLPGAIKFKEPYIVNKSLPNEYHFWLHDLDKDGRVDLFSPNYFYFNQSNTDSLSFNPVFLNDYAGGSPVSGQLQNTQMVAYDLDNNGETEIFALRPTYPNNNFLTLKALPGEVSIKEINYMVPFDCEIFYNTPADFNNDGKIDFLSICEFNEAFIYLNVSTPGNIEFRKIPIPYDLPLYNDFINIGDFNGDGKMDFIRVSEDLLIFINNSSGDDIKFLEPISLPYTKYYLSNPDLNIADMDNDGRVDIIFSDKTSAPIQIFRNLIGTHIPLFVCPNNPASLSSLKTGSSYQWQLSTNGFNFNNLANGNGFSGVSSSTLNIANVTTDIDRKTFRCVVDGQPEIPISIRIFNRWTGANNNLWSNPGNWSCGTVPQGDIEVEIGGEVEIDIDVTIGKIILKPGGTVNVAAGKKLIVLRNP